MRSFHSATRVAMAASLFVVVLACACATRDGAAKQESAKVGEAPLPDDAPRREAAEIVERSGLGTKLEAASRVAEFFVGNMRETAARLGADHGDDAVMLETLTNIALHSAGPAYDAARLRTSVELVLAEMPARERERVLAHYRDPRADRIALVYAELATQAGQHRLARFLARVRNGEVDPTKVLVIEGMLGASREVDLTVALAFDTSTSFLAALEPALPPTIREPRERLALRREAFESSAKRQLTMQLAYVFSQLDDEDLAAEARFFASSEGRAFAEWRIRAAERALAVAEREATKRVTAALESMKPDAATPTEPPIDA